MAKVQESTSSDSAVAEASAAAASVAVADPVIYLGPRLLKPVHVVPNAVFRGGLPAELAALAAEDSDVKACFVPVAEAGKALRGTGAAALAQARANIVNRYLGRK